MRCSCCGKEIKNGESFYEIEGEYYCQDCVKERTVTYYTIVGDEEEPIEEDDVSEYYYLEELIDHLKFELEWCIERIEKSKKELNEYAKNSISWKAIKSEIKYYNEDLEKLKKEIKELEDINNESSQ